MAKSAEYACRPLELRRSLEAVAEAARAEVLAQGYRSSDMARALKTLYGEFWFETYVPPAPPRCAWSVTTDMDDGPLIQRCQLPPHGIDVEHRMRPAYSDAKGERNVRGTNERSA